MREIEPIYRAPASEEFEQSEHLKGTDPYITLEERKRALRRWDRTYESAHPTRLRIVAGALALSVVGVSIGAVFYYGNETHREENIPQPPDTCTGSQNMEVAPQSDVNQTIAQAINELEASTGVKTTVSQMRTAINTRNTVTIWQPGHESTWHLKDGYTSIVIPISCTQLESN